jgi:hypothetical protein
MRQNLCANPAAKVDTTGWAGSGTPVRATDFPANLPRQTGVRASTSGFIQTAPAPCAPGDVFTVSFYQHNGSAAFQFSRTAYIGYTRSSGGDTFPETFNTGSLGDIGAVLRTSFTTAAAPANATGIYVLWDSLAVGLGMTGVLLEKVSALDVYGDGDVPGWTWDGSAGNSSSTMVAETLFSSQEPVTHNQYDTTTYSLGSYITAAVAGTVTHVRRWSPATSSQPSGVTVKAALYDWSDGSKLTSGSDVAFTSGIQDWWDYAELATPIHVSAGAQICPAIRTEAYVSSTGASSPWPITSGDLSAATGAGHFRDMAGLPGGPGANPDTTFPDSVFNNGCYFVDVVFVPDSGDAPAEGQAALTLGLAVAATGAAPAEGSAGVGLGLAVASAGSARAEGQVALSLGLGITSAGARDSLGAAALGLGLAVVSAGHRASLGATALGLNLAVAARGLNGTSGRGVAPFPYGPRTGSSFPWPPRPVKSFQEVTEP